MKLITWLIVSLTLFIATGVADSVEARPARTACVGDLSDQTIDGDLIVPARETCTLINVTVRGSVRVDERSGLEVIASRIDGGVTGARFERVSFRDAAVGGPIRLTGGNSAVLERTSVAGATRLVEQVDVRVLESRVQGNLVMLGSREVAMLCGATVEGDARFAEHRGGLLIGDAPILPGFCSANEVWGNLRVHHNQSDTIIANTAVGRNLVCTANDPAPAVYGNTVGGAARGQCGDGAPVDAVELDDGAA